MIKLQPLVAPASYTFAFVALPYKYSHLIRYAFSPVVVGPFDALECIKLAL
ncbi:MAG: hypothetical protein WA666_00395 [Nitrospirota bacterium]